MPYNPILTNRDRRLAKIPVRRPCFKAAGPAVIPSGRKPVAQEEFPATIRSFRHARRASGALLVPLGEGSELAARKSFVHNLGKPFWPVARIHRLLHLFNGQYRGVRVLFCS